MERFWEREHEQKPHEILQFAPHQLRKDKGPMEFMRACNEPLYDMQPLQFDQNRHVYSTQNWLTESVYFVRTQNDAMAVRRTKAQAENGGHLLFVNRYFGGYVRGHTNGLSLDRDPGSIYAFDLSTSVECIQYPTIVEGFFISKSELGYDPDRHPPLIGFSQSHPLGRAIYRQFDNVFAELNTRNALHSIAFDRLIASMRLAMGTDQKQSDVRSLARDAMAEEIRAFIERSIETPDLTVSQILSVFGVSRASLYRMFELYGGVRQYISDRRLYRAVLEISSRQLRRGDISSISEKWGFSTDANFNRAVRRNFGVPPGSLGYQPTDTHAFKTSSQIVYDFLNRTDEPITA